MIPLCRNAIHSGAFFCSIGIGTFQFYHNTVFSIEQKNRCAGIFHSHSGSFPFVFSLQPDRIRQRICILPVLNSKFFFIKFMDLINNYFFNFRINCSRSAICNTWDKLRQISILHTCSSCFFAYLFFRCICTVYS